MTTKKRVFAGFLGLLFLAGCAGQERTPQANTTTTTTSGARADAESTRAVTNKFFDDVWAKKNCDAVSTVAAADLVNHAAIPEAQGAEGLRTICKKVMAAFPDMKTKIESVVVEGDRAFARVTNEGTQTGTLEFKTPVPPSGKAMRMVQIHELRIKDGKVVELWMTQERSEIAK